MNYIEKIFGADFDDYKYVRTSCKALLNGHKERLNISEAKNGWRAEISPVLDIVYMRYKNLLDLSDLRKIIDIELDSPLEFCVLIGLIEYCYLNNIHVYFIFPSSNVESVYPMVCYSQVLNITPQYKVGERFMDFRLKLFNTWDGIGARNYSEMIVKLDGVSYHADPAKDKDKDRKTLQDYGIFVFRKRSDKIWKDNYYCLQTARQIMICLSNKVFTRNYS